MMHRWIAERLRMGTASHLTHLLYGGKIKSKLPRTDPFNPRNFHWRRAFGPTWPGRGSQNSGCDCCATSRQGHWTDSIVSRGQCGWGEPRTGRATDGRTWDGNPYRRMVRLQRIGEIGLSVTLVHYPKQNPPTDSADEAKISALLICCFQIGF